MTVRGQSMRVAIAFPGCHRRGGVERVMVECVNFLAARGHEVHVYSQEVDDAAIAATVKIHRIGGRSVFPFNRVPAFVRACQRELHQHRPLPDVTAGFGVAAVPDSIVWMQSVHAAWIEESQRRRNLRGRVKQRLNPFHAVILRMEKRMMSGQRYRKVIALSARVKEDIQRFYSVPSDDIIVIPNGFSASEFNREYTTSKRAVMRQKLGFVESDQVVIFVGNELERKGFFPLLRAVARLRSRKVRLLVVGDLDKGACARDIQSLGLRDNICFTGPTDRVADFFSAADIFALPTFYEAWGLVIVEALACGLPVVTSRLAGASTAVNEAHNGFLVDNPANDEDICEKLRLLLAGKHDSSAAISTSVARFEWSRVLPKYEAALVEYRINAGTVDQ